MLALSLLACGSARRPAEGDAATAGKAGPAGSAGQPADLAGLDNPSQAGADAPTLPAACTVPIGSCLAGSEGWRVLLDAKDFGSDARLVAMGGLSVLVSMGNATFRIARLHDPG